MLPRKHPDRIRVAFDDHRLVANAGDKLMTLVASALSGGDCIDDADALRSGSTGRVLGCVVKAPSTLGTFLRSFSRRRFGPGRGGCVAASIECSCFGAGMLFQNHHPRCTGAPSCRFRSLTRRPPSVDSGLGVVIS